MADTFPVSSATGLVNGTRLVTNNVDPSAPLVITAGSGTLINGASSILVGPGRSVEWIYDATGGTPTWRSTKNGLTTMLTTNNLSDLTNPAAARDNLNVPTRGQALTFALAF